MATFGGEGSVGLSGAGKRRDGSGTGGTLGVPVVERDEAAASSSGAAGPADMGVLCTRDFKLSPSVASICEEVARFAAPPCLNELFQRVPVDKMFRSIKANAMRVSFTHAPAP